MTLNQEQIDYYHCHGYLNIGRVFPDELLENLRATYDAEFEKAWETNAYRNLAVDDAVSGDDKQFADKRMYQITQMCERSIHFRKLLFHEPIIGAFADIIGPNIQLFHDQALWKPAGKGGAVFWHQDNGYWRCRPANLISCWIALDDAYEANGAMQVIPGSHLTPCWHDQAESDALLEVKPESLEQRKVIELKAGEAMIHHCQTLHYTQPNETDDHRRAFVIHAMSAGTVDRHGQAMPVSWSHPLLKAGLS